MQQEFDWANPTEQNIDIVPMRRCTEEDFSKVNAPQNYEQMKAWVGKERVVCPDLSNANLRGNLQSNSFKI